MATERKQFCFSGIECHKPSVTTFNNTTQVYSSSPADSTFSTKWTYQDWNREWCHMHRSLFLKIAKIINKNQGVRLAQKLIPEELQHW